MFSARIGAMKSSRLLSILLGVLLLALGVPRYDLRQAPWPSSQTGAILRPTEAIHTIQSPA